MNGQFRAASAARRVSGTVRIIVVAMVPAKVGTIPELENATVNQDYSLDEKELAQKNRRQQKTTVQYRRVSFLGIRTGEKYVNHAENVASLNLLIRNHDAQLGANFQNQMRSGYSAQPVIDAWITE